MADNKDTDQANAEFDKSFDEFAEAKATGAPAPDARDGDDAAKNADGAAGAEQEAPVKDNDDAAAAADAKASGKDADENQGKDKDGDAGHVTLTEEQLAKLDPDARSAFEALQTQLAASTQRENTHKGRVSALQRLNNLTDKVARLQTSGATSAIVNKEVKAYLESEGFKKLKDTSPEFAEPFEALASTLQTVTGALADDVQAVARESRNEVQQNHGEYVIEQHPDYADVVGAGKPEQAAKFGAWVKSQPGWVQDVYRQNSKGIVNGGNVVEVIDRYKTQHASEFKGTTGKEVSRSPADGDDAGGQGANPNPDDVVRNRRKDAGRAPQNKGVGAAAGAPDEFDAAFDHFSKVNDQKRSQQARRA